MKEKDQCPMCGSFDVALVRDVRYPHPDDPDGEVISGPTVVYCSSCRARTALEK